jgi:hypothetical protein
MANASNKEALIWRVANPTKNPGLYSLPYQAHRNKFPPFRGRKTHCMDPRTLCSRFLVKKDTDARISRPAALTRLLGELYMTPLSRSITLPIHNSSLAGERHDFEDTNNPSDSRNDFRRIVAEPQSSRSRATNKISSK